ncbi:MAG: hypothetical protein CENE_02065 [Candidatus Celerinatantimonas neptuna]|nr:MAG: hypothetical protein CENE_02065 [Candidatus Celerinatantimonas neptuna]
MRFFVGMFDRLLFAAAFIIAMQLPQYITLYQQRLDGFLQSNQQQLDHFQSMAHHQQLPSLTVLIQKMKSSHEKITQETGQLIEQTREQNQHLHRAVNALNHQNLLSQIWALIRYPEPKLLSATLKDYEPGIALTLPALSCAFIAAILFMLIKHFLIHLLTRKRRWFDSSRNPLR